MPATALVTTLWIGEEAAEGIGVAREQLVRPALRECLAGLQVDQYTSRIQQNDSIARDVVGVVKAKHELCALVEGLNDHRRGVRGQCLTVGRRTDGVSLPAGLNRTGTHRPSVCDGGSSRRSLASASALLDLPLCISD
jgi:hypothetical protein